MPAENLADINILKAEAEFINICTADVINHVAIRLILHLRGWAKVQLQRGTWMLESCPRKPSCQLQRGTLFYNCPKLAS